ncbi:hypothetical protein [Streptomyces cellulosae]|uniref:hypothetical protein n=1 Tax=Streptomyces cellulosae TaxID=1968 RepID=UPI0004C74D4F|nr:hypothetical protein [Streptomyces cellulosae]
MLTLTGAGGVGKTRLALEAAAVSAKTFPDGAWLVDLAPVREAAAVAGVAANALGMPDLGTQRSSPLAAISLRDLTEYLASVRSG